MRWSMKKFRRIVDEHRALWAAEHIVANGTKGG